MRKGQRAPGSVSVNVDKVNDEINRVTRALGCTKQMMSEVITGTKSSLFGYMSKGTMQDVWLDKLEVYYGIKKADIIIPEEQEEQSGEPLETGELLQKLIEAVENVSLEIRALKNKVDQVGSDLSSDINELHQMINAKPTPIAPADLKKIIEEGTDHDKTEDIIRGLKCSKDVLIETVSFGINRSLQKQEANRRK